MEDRARKVELSPEERRRRRIAIVGLAAVVLIIAVSAILLGAPLIRWVTDPAQFRAWAQGHGAAAKWVMLGIAAIQVVIAFIPGEPVQIAAGMAFGTLWGVVLTIGGIALGQAIVFYLVRRYGMRFIELFFDKETIYNLPLFKSRRRLETLVLLLFFIPGAPKDVLTFAAALTPINMARFLGLSMLARTPAIIASSWGGSAITSNELTTAITVLGITALAGLGGILLYRRIQRRPSLTSQESRENTNNKESTDNT